MIRGAEWVVESRDEGSRLDRFLCSRSGGVGRAAVTRAIEEGRVLVNGCNARKSRVLSAGDRIGLVDFPERSDYRALPDPSVCLEIVYEDGCILGLNKPGLMPVHPVEPFETGTLANGLVAKYPELASIGDDPMFPSMVHRIDNDTTGLVLAAKTRAAYDDLRSQFAQHKVVKTYLAVVWGCMKHGGVADLPLVHDPSNRGRMLVASGKEHGARIFRAVSTINVLCRDDSKTLVEVEIRTGVTHQIRCSLAHMGHPVVGDLVYGKGTEAIGEDRKNHFLHSWKAVFRHPGTGGETTVEAPAPGHFAAAGGSFTDALLLRRGTRQASQAPSSST